MKDCCNYDLNLKNQLINFSMVARFYLVVQIRVRPSYFQKTTNYPLDFKITHLWKPEGFKKFESPQYARGPLNLY